MKKLILLVLLSVLLPTVWAADGCNQHRLTREEFQAKQKTYIIEKAGLTSDEAARFFPVYFELQDRKKILQDEAWHLMREGNEKGVTEAKYEEILEAVFDARLSIDGLDKTYFDKFKKILSCRKIFLVQKAEMRFHRELLREMRGKGKK